MREDKKYLLLLSKALYAARDEAMKPAGERYERRMAELRAEGLDEYELEEAREETEERFNDEVRYVRQTHHAFMMLLNGYENDK